MMCEMARTVVAALELPGTGGSRADRIAMANEAISAAGPADLYVLPEACFPGYRHEPAKEEEACRAWAQATGRRVIVGYVEGNAAFAGLAEPGGAWRRYQKRFPTPAESRSWRAGAETGVFDTGIGRIGVLICADVLHLRAWEDLRGRVDLIAVSAAWPDYAGRRAPPGLGWLYAESNAYRDVLVARAARSLGVPVVFANAGGCGFSGGSAVFAMNGERLPPVAAVETGGPTPIGPPIRHPPRWRAFTAAYRATARAVELVPR